MLVVDRGRIVADDPWVHLDAEAPVPEGTPVIVPLARWHSEADALTAGGRLVGVRLAAGEMIDEIEADLPRLALVALEFPSFRDGRAYSKARILRDRHRFGGQIRAIGNVLRDQFLFIARCGIDVVEVADRSQADAWALELQRFSVFYQPASDDRMPAAIIRRHRAARAAE